MIERLGMSLLFITHNLGVVRPCLRQDRRDVRLAHRRARRQARDLRQPQHPYTIGLLNSIPRLDTQAKYLTPIEGTVCNMMAPPTGCKFHPRCAHAMAVCREQAPRLKELAPGHFAACHLHERSEPMTMQLPATRCSTSRA
jgi:oligopeptide/dipeptide ABC transporter ATP-binding protein